MPTTRRLTAADAAAFHAIRLEGLTLHPSQFRSAPEDWAGARLADVADRLTRDVVIGGFAGDTLVGVGGLGRESRPRLRHKAFIWGMYVRQLARGTGLADAIVERLLDHARADGVERVLLTVSADNWPARRLYERCGFEVYGIEAHAIKMGDQYVDEAMMVRRLP